jgi:hypothetical protein
MDMRTIITLGLVSLLASGCFREADDFVARAAELGCEQQEECDPDAFELAYQDDLDACIDDVIGGYDEQVESCEYDAKAGRKCIREMKKLSCGDEVEEDGDCSQVFTDCGAGE